MARPDRPRPLQLEAWRSFLEAHARVTAVLDDELKAAHGLQLTWYDVLVQLSSAGGRLRMSELADAVLLSRSNCTRLIDRMDSAGLVRREADPADARSRWAVLTDQGMRQLRAAAGTHLDGVERYFTSLVTDRQATDLATLFAQVAEAARASEAADTAEAAVMSAAAEAPTT